MSLRNYFVQIWLFKPLLKGSYNIFSKLRDLDVMTWPSTIWLVSIESIPLDLPVRQTWWSYVFRKWRYQFLYQFLHEYLRKSWPRSAILRDFQNQEYRFTILKSRKSLDEGRNAIAKHYALQAIADKLFEDKIIDEHVTRCIIIFTKTKHQSAGTDHTGMKTVKFPIKLPTNQYVNPNSIHLCFPIQTSKSANEMQI